MTASLDHLFMNRIEDIIAKEKWLTKDPIRSLHDNSGNTSAVAPPAACPSPPALPPRPGRQFSPRLLLLCLVVLILMLVILIVYML
jgi:hypothetical protein